jgi:hypothetical protein
MPWLRFPTKKDISVSAGSAKQKSELEPSNMVRVEAVVFSFDLKLESLTV